MPESRYIAEQHSVPGALESVTPQPGQNSVWSPALQRVVRQTLEAVLSEGLVDCVIAPSLKRKRDKQGWGTVYFGLGGRGYSCRGKRGGFDSVRLKIDNLRRLGLQTRPVNLTEFLRELVDALPGEPGAKRRFWEELQQTIESTESSEQNLYPETDRRSFGFAALESALSERHPYHPWQWHNRLAPKQRVANRSVFELGHPGDGYRPSQSVGTLLNDSDPTRSNVSLPLDILSRRFLSRRAVDSAPGESGKLAKRVADDNFFQHFPLVVLEEFASARVVETEVFEESDPAICQFGVIWRESVESRHRSEERAVPMTALAAVEADGKPFIEPWVAHHGVRPWLAQLFDTLVLPVWHLLAEHGVALEDFAQNCILIHVDGWPARLALRGFYESREPGELSSERLMENLFVFQLSGLAALCEHFYLLSESEFWALLQDRLSAYHESGYGNAVKRAPLGQNARSIRVQSPLRQKLCPHDRGHHHEVRNPLFSSGLRE